ncbi:uncharacterized protein EI97DRAFT_1332 [Westerdykella ornata]|uniref:Uncharacterized protein n=1 Tax=Westerdykella ornata TaxID=318751 RepID=A0A6A6JXN9_WESOR|nr:uncharacterized protein EI97DRAFT_1332 [Westerdykella ornata]KAF2280578.1 hypothetical protein EI97DRAFT_1332 [Westerdykella ornata]
MRQASGKDVLVPRNAHCADMHCSSSRIACLLEGYGLLPIVYILCSTMHMVPRLGYLGPLLCTLQRTFVPPPPPSPFWILGIMSAISATVRFPSPTAMYYVLRNCVITVAPTPPSHVWRLACCWLASQSTVTNNNKKSSSAAMHDDLSVTVAHR